MLTRLTPPCTEQHQGSPKSCASRDGEQSALERVSTLDRFVSLMRAPAVYIRMMLTNVAFCLMCYLHYRSVGTTLYYGAVCLVLMQFGYFGGVIYLVLRERHAR
jgi:hypothetical protein